MKTVLGTSLHIDFTINLAIKLRNTFHNPQQERNQNHIKSDS